jgi:FKBP-type peptidyl-prolyl cis-trans isomerase FkpA
MTRKYLPALALLAASLVGCNAGGAKPAGPASTALKTDDEKAIYSLGVMMGRNVKALRLSEVEVAVLMRGLTDAAAGKKPEVDPETFGPHLQQLAQARAAVGADEEKTKSQAYRDAAAKEPGAVKTNSGMVFRTLSPGTGATPTSTDRVRVQYQGTLTDGTVFDSSIKRGQPAEFPLAGVIPCWTEGLQRMKVGEKAKLVCPAEIAYGDQGRPPVIPGGATLVFQVELLSILKK